MSSARSMSKAPVGSTNWVLDERQQARQFVEQEVEEFAFSARNELEWLNEHMSDIFSRKEFDVAEVFKTPGKLRGKTPRTARKYTPGQSRAPLTDIFSSNPPNKTHSPKTTGFYKKITQFQVAEDKENALTTANRSSQKDTRHVAHNINTDSGYHEMSDDQENEKPVSPPKPAPKLPPRSPERLEAVTLPSPPRLKPLQSLQTSYKDSDASFVSAKEAPVAIAGTATATQASETATELVEPAEPLASAQKAIVPEGLQPRVSNQYSVSATTADGLDNALEEVERKSPVRPHKSNSPSETSSPDRPVIRKKSSLNFASLPAREPLSTKMSMGRRPSQTRGSIRGGAALRDSTFVKPPISQKKPEEQDDVTGSRDAHMHSISSKDDSRPDLSIEPSALHSKTSTQRLHERITMLGQTKQARPSKSIPPVTTAVPSQGLRDHQIVRSQRGETTTEETDDDWIAPISGRTTQSSQTMPGSFSTTSAQWLNQTQESTLIESFVPETQTMTEKDPSVSLAKPSYPKLPAPVADSTTPAGSPAAPRWQVDGPLSASKAKFSSFLKSAKGMFASSAATSAQAKVETLSPGHSRPVVGIEQTDMFQPPIADDHHTLHAAGHQTQDDQDSATTQKQSHSSRRSSQRVLEKEGKEKPDSDAIDPFHDRHDLQESALEEDLKTKPPPQMRHEKSAQQPNTIEQGSVTGPKRPKAFLGQASQSGELRRPMKVSKTQAGPAKGSFSIRVPSQKTANNLNASTLGNAPHESISTTGAPPRPTLTKKGSSSSLRSTSTTQTSKTIGTSNSRLKALDAAAKTREKEERDRQRKADEKRERERKRAQADEDEKRQLLERQAAEQQRERDEQEARVAAQKQRAEAQRKNEHLRQQAEAARLAVLEQQQNTCNEPASNHERPEAKVARPAPKAIPDNQSAANIRPHVNPAKPKRYFQPDADDERQASNRPTGGQHTPAFVAANNGAKRRKTNDEDAAASANANRPTMAPPMRPSISRKQEVPVKFAQGYMSSSASNAQHPTQAPSMLKTAVTNHQISHGGPKTPHSMTDLAKFSNARIPFAEAPNPPGQQQHGFPQSYVQKPQQHQKTPGTASKSTHKSSPQYPAGDSISLPEIATDSEDSDADDDDGFVPPAWANSPELRQLLAQQQLRDPREVFGPIAPLAMEEVFKGGSKERTARFRNRTSSANWAGADRLTNEERRRDREAREKLEREGGWVFSADV